MKIRFNTYQWRLFFPLVGLMWLVIIAQAIFQNEREVQYRKDRLYDDLRLVNSRIIDAYEDNFDMTPFMHFVAKYYENSELNGIRISIYNNEGKLLYCLGQLIPYYTDGTTPPEMVEALNRGSGVALRASQLPENNNHLYFFGVNISRDGKLYVHTAMPFTDRIYNRVATSDARWIAFIIFAVIVTVLTFISTRFLGRNVRLLHDFARRANENKPLDVDEFRFSSDELGDIARQIVTLFNERQQANRRIAQEHEIAIRATEDKITSMRQMSNNINHELKTPVGVIKGYLDTIASDPDMPSDQRQMFLQKAQTHMDRLCTLLADLASIARLEDGSKEIALERINVTDLLVEISADLRDSAALKSGIQFTFDVPADCFVIANTNLLWAMMGNLIRNADFYSGGTECRLTLVQQDNDFVTFSFADNGRGVAPEHLPYLFDRFYRVDKGRTRKSGGTGLGLPIVKNTVEALGGTITVCNSSTMGGLEFIFTLRRWHPGDEKNIGTVDSSAFLI